MSATTTQLREAFVAGAKAQYGRLSQYTIDAFEADAKKAYPAPTITRPRVVSLTDAYARVADARINNGRLEIRHVWKEGSEFRTGLWRPSKHTPQSLQICLDLYANPTETVEVGE